MEDESQLIISLALIYLDRFASFDTPPDDVDPQTSRPWCPIPARTCCRIRFIINSKI